MASNAGRPTALGLLVLTGVCAFGFQETLPWLAGAYFYVPLLFGFVALSSSAKFLGVLFGYGLNAINQMDAKRPTRKHGSARWASWRDIRKELSRKRASFWGVYKGRPLFIDYESCALTVAPSGLGKTTCTVIPNVFSRPRSVSALVADTKSEIACITARAVRRYLGQAVVILNPGGVNEDILGRTARYNPLHLLVRALEDSKGPVNLVPDTQSLTLQLSPEPPEPGENIFFRNGSRKLLVFAFLVLVLEHGRKATLTMALSLLRDVNRLEEELYKARLSLALNGELADLASDILAKRAEGDAKQFDSFREGATQAIEIYSPSSVLAYCVSESDFSFAELRDKPTTVYVILDQTRKALASWQALMIWCAKTELMRRTSGQPVQFILDEATGVRIDGIDDLLTRARGFKLKLHFVIQEIDDWVRVNGKQSLSVLLANAEIQQWFGSRSHETLKMLSEKLGDTTVKTTSYNFGRGVHERIQPTLNETSRRQMTPTEIAQMQDSLLWVRRCPPIRATLVGYHEVDPWGRAWADMNPFTGKRFRGRTKLRL